MKTSSKRKKRAEMAQDPAGGRSLIYGRLPAIEALRSDSDEVDTIYISHGAKQSGVAEIEGIARNSGVKVVKLAPARFRKMVPDGTNHQGVIAAVFSPRYFDSVKLVEEIAQKQGALCLILDGIEDPRNLGAILRTAEASGVDGVFIPERRAAGLTATVAKSSAGAVSHLKIARVKNVNRLIDELKSKNVWVVGTVGDSNVSYTDWDWEPSTALVLGNEGKGIRRLTAEKCDALVKIPMCGKIDSLNVSVAAGVVLFEAVRQRGKRQDVLP